VISFLFRTDPSPLAPFPTRRSSDLIFVKLSDAPSTVMVMYRMFLACPLLFPLCIKYRKSFLQITKTEWLAIIIAGVFLGAHFGRSEEHTSELPSRFDVVCRLLL